MAREIDLDLMIEDQNGRTHVFSLSASYSYSKASRGLPIERGHPLREPDQEAEAEIYDVRCLGPGRKWRHVHQGLPDKLMNILEEKALEQEGDQ